MNVIKRQAPAPRTMDAGELTPWVNQFAEELTLLRYSPLTIQGYTIALAILPRGLQLRRSNSVSSTTTFLAGSPSIVVVAGAHGEPCPARLAILTVFIVLSRFLPDVASSLLWLRPSQTPLTLWLAISRNGSCDIEAFANRQPYDTGEWSCGFSRHWDRIRTLMLASEWLFSTKPNTAP
ncbi:hypothetical protein [Roseicitreum antarcticum]|uniref:hypothetical protein n=1 Tax=Roseicitreum antarcticum TaxID=564137 RepID=UPI001CC1F644|nr:hypothetical protein [Roseicitreum antarcticum]